MEHLVTTGKMEGKYSRVRPREKTEEMAQWLHGANVVDMLKTTDEKRWRNKTDTAAKAW